MTTADIFEIGVFVFIGTVVLVSIASALKGVSEPRECNNCRKNEIVKYPKSKYRDIQYIPNKEE